MYHPDPDHPKVPIGVDNRRLKRTVLSQELSVRLPIDLPLHQFLELLAEDVQSVLGLIKKPLRTTPPYPVCVPNLNVPSTERFVGMSGPHDRASTCEVLP